jgi:hypothetical protein
MFVGFPCHANRERLMRRLRTEMGKGHWPYMGPISDSAAFVIV